ncbi:myotubularin-related protein 14 [Musca domestica]|uniref:Myotubularin-related protein 14 n=1 Tax=Musca domestica TaxID=7370 RepID=A0ABM3USQ1_MUSDO|nr:myotubularin-related protein 14 [Musca domestica]XP_058976566.1 myotubularin-related protein 14 [Musca domestica]
MANTQEVTQKDLHDLLEIFERKSFEAGPCEEGTLEEDITKKCEFLFKQDYSLIELENTNGILSPRYPGRIFIPEYEHNRPNNMASTITANNTNIFSQNATPQNSSINGFHHQHHLHYANNSTTANTTSSNGSMSSLSSSTATALNMGTANNGIHAFVTFANGSMSQTTTNGVPNNLPTAAPAPPHPYFSTQMQYPQHLMPQTTPNTSVGLNGGGGGGNGTTSTSTSYQHTIYEDLYDVNKIRELITMAKYARCRQRFAVPVIMYRGKYICRSATISVMPETYGRKVVDYAYDCLNGTNYSDRGNHIVDDENNDNNEDSLMNHALNESSPFSYDEVIKSDIQLLNALNVSAIVDLMVEKRKIKYFMAVSSSEKADPENHYEEFNILSLPYPGCEFFKKFRDNNYMAKNLYYNWKQSFNDAIISVPKAGPTADLNINWSDYKQWDLVQITQNYLKACLKYIQEENSGLLIHCISGWDRTPLFISLVRLSLWADGLIHQNLNALQMAYLTLAYDWYLFGHQLPDRLKRGEDIMFFCFHVLKYITDEEFSIVEHRKRTKTSSSSGSSVIVIKSDCCDDEPLKEDFILSYDQDSNDSFSNSSNCDMSITDNFYATSATTTTTMPTASVTAQQQMVMNPFTSRSPNPKRSKTSPISVPGVSATRQRQESTSSNGSWQVVTDTGSIDSMMNGSYMMHFISQQQPDNISITSCNSGHYVMTGNGSTTGNGYNCHSNTPSNGSNASLSSNGINNGGNGGGALNFLTNGINDKDLMNGSSKTSTIMRKKRLNAVRAIFIQAYGKTVGLKFKEGSAMNLATFIGTLADQLF